MGSRATATAIIWLAYLTIVGIAMGELGNWSILLAFVLMMPLIPIMGLMWTAKGESSENHKHDAAAKRKRERERIDIVRDLSDEDLEQLKQRLMAHDLDDNSGYMLADDGEIVMLNEKKRR